MARRRSFGKLFIAWGPEAVAHLEDKFGRMDRALFRRNPDDVVDSVRGFYGFDTTDNPDPFTSPFWGFIVQGLVSARPVVLYDKRFEDARHRNKVEKAFLRVFPDLDIEHFQLGGPPRADDGSDGRDQGIVIDEDVYEDGEMSSNESIVVESSAPASEVVAALTRASERMMLVGEDGREYREDELGGGGGVDVYTPNYVSDVTFDEGGRPGFYIDCKGAIEPEMAAQFRQVLREELQRHGVTSAHVRVRA